MLVTFTRPRTRCEIPGVLVGVEVPYGVAVEVANGGALRVGAAVGPLPGVPVGTTVGVGVEDPAGTDVGVGVAAPPGTLTLTTAMFPE